MHIYSQTKFELSTLINSWCMRGSQKSEIASWCFWSRHLVEKMFIYVKAPTRINSHTKFQLGFSKFLFLNRQNLHKGGTASLCQILSKSRPRYVSFNIMLVWLENAYSPPFWVVWGTFPQNDVTHRLNPKIDHPWAEPRHLSHKPLIFSYWFLNGPYMEPHNVKPMGNRGLM